MRGQRRARSVQYSSVRRLVQNEASSFQICASISAGTAFVDAASINIRAKSSDGAGRGSRASSSKVTVSMRMATALQPVVPFAAAHYSSVQWKRS